MIAISTFSEKGVGPSTPNADADGMTPTGPRDPDRRGFFRALREWAVEETKAIAEPFVEDIAEQIAPVMAEMAGPQVIRPPGARREEAFREACTQCGDCVSACPERAITVFPEEVLPVAGGYPVIVPRRRACYECKTLHCVEACEPGALVPIRRDQIKIGEARVMTATCYAHQGSACSTCHTICPHRGEAIVMERGKPRVQPEHCTGCGLCEYVCPTHPSSIRVLSPR